MECWSYIKYTLKKFQNLYDMYFYKKNKIIKALVTLLMVIPSFYTDFFFKHFYLCTFITNLKSKTESVGENNVCH